MSLLLLFMRRSLGCCVAQAGLELTIVPLLPVPWYHRSKYTIPLRWRQHFKILRKRGRLAPEATVLAKLVDVIWLQRMCLVQTKLRQHACFFLVIVWSHTQVNNGTVQERISSGARASLTVLVSSWSGPIKKTKETRDFLSI